MIDKEERVKVITKKSEITDDLQFISFLFDTPNEKNITIRYKNALLETYDFLLNVAGYNGAETFLPSGDFPEISDPCMVLLKNKTIFKKIAAETKYKDLLKIFEKEFG